MAGTGTRMARRAPRRAMSAMFAGGLLAIGLGGAVAAQQVLVGAGDVAGSWSADEATAKLLDGLFPTLATPGTVFTVGDNAYGSGTASEFTTYYLPTWGRHKARTRPSPGNHDYLSSGAGPYFSYYGANAGPAGQGYYSYTLGDWKIISLNSNVASGVGSAQEKWLRQELTANPKNCTLAYWHHARFSSGSGHGSDTRTAALFQALYEFGADVVVTGHDHIYERFGPQKPSGQADPTGIREFVVGTGGASLVGIGSIKANSEVRNTATHGVLKLTLNSTSYDWAFIPVAGQTFRDTGSMSCFAAAPPPPPPDATSITLNVTDGWDSRNRVMLAQGGALSAVTASDDVRFDIWPNQFLSLQFAGLTNLGTMQDARLFIEHHEEDLFRAGSLVLQAGGGALTDPFVARELAPPVRLTAANEGTLEWDVTAWARDATRVNDFKLVIRNLDPGAKKIRLDRAYLAVTYGTPPVVTPTTIQVRLFPTDGWDRQLSRTLSADARVYLAQGSDNLRTNINAGFGVTYEFQNIPSSAVVRSASFFVEHSEQTDISANPLRWEAAIGDVKSPTVLATLRPSVLSGSSREATVSWDIGATIDTLAEVNDLKLTINNDATNGLQTRVDRAYAVVTFDEP